MSGVGVPRHRVESAWIWFGAAALAGAVVLALRHTKPVVARHRIPRVLDPLLIALALIAFWPATTIGLLSDDFVLRSWAERGELMPPEWPQIRALPLALWRLVLWLAGPSNAPTMLHICSIALHGVNSALVWRLAVATGAVPSSAIAAAVLFGVSPIAVEPVAWLSAMPDVMVTTLMLAAIVVTLTGRDRGRASIIAIGLVVTALCTKENALIAGPLVLLTALVVHGPDRRRVLQIGMAATTLSVAFLAWRAWAGRLDQISRPFDRLTIKNFLTGPFAVFGLPLHGDLLAVTRVFSASWVTMLAMAVVVSSTGWRMTPHLARRLLFAALWVLVALLPAYGVFAVMNDLQGSRYLYLSAVGWCIGMASLVEMVRPGRARTIATALVVIAMVAGGATGIRGHLAIWQDAARVRDRIMSSALALPPGCRDVVVVNVPDNVRGAYVFRNGLGEAIGSSGRRLAPASEPTVAPECRVDAAGVSSQP